MYVCVWGGGDCLGSPFFPILQQDEVIPVPQSAAQRRSKPPLTSAVGLKAKGI